MGKITTKYKRTFICTLLYVATYLVGLAQVNISGVITNGDNDPIDFATIRIEGTSVGTNSDTKGRYELKVAERDTIVVVFSCMGYKEKKQQLLKPKGKVTLNMRLFHTAKELQEVEVVEIKKQTSAMQTLDASSYQLAPVVGAGGIESMLSTMAGVSSKNEMSSQYMVRGGSYDENSVYINGIEVYRPQLVTSGQQEGLSIINPDMVGSVQFSTGGFTPEYADKMSSVLDITYRRPERFEGKVTASLQGATLMLGHSTKRFSQMHGVRYKRNAMLFGSLESKGEYDPQFFDYQTNLIFDINPKWSVNALGYIALNNYRFTPTTRTTSFGTDTNAKTFKVYFDGQEKDRFQTFFAAATVGFRPTRNTQFSLTGSGYMTNEYVSYDISGEYWLDAAGTSDIGGEQGIGKYLEHARNRLKTKVISLDLKGKHTIRKNNTLSYGFTFRHESIHDRQREWQMTDSAGYTPGNTSGPKTAYNLISSNDISSNRIALYVQDNAKFSTKGGLFILNGGVRLSYWGFNKELLVSPRVSLGFIPEKAPNLSLRLSGGLYYQAPYYKEYRVQNKDEYGNTHISLNRDIKSQRSIQAIFGTDYTFRALNRPFKITAEVYYKNLANLIPYEIDNLKLVYSGRNESKGYVAGIDFKIFGQFVPGTDSWLSFSLMKTQEILNGVKVPRPTDQRYSVALYFTDFFPKVPRLKFSLRGIISDGLPVTAPQKTRDQKYFRIPAYKRLDIGVSFQLVGYSKNGMRPDNFWKNFKAIWIGVDVFNLLDISNVSGYYWVTDANNLQYAVPNYLTRRQFNVRLSIEF